MSIQLDPQKREIRALLQVAGDFAGKQVLEVGCGDGRLTWRYAQRAASVVGIDPNADKIARAISMTPEHFHGHLDLRVSDLEAFALVWSKEQPGVLFDLVLLSWSL